MNYIYINVQAKSKLEARERVKRQRELDFADSVPYNTCSTMPNGGALEGSKLFKMYQDLNYFELIKSDDTGLAHSVVDATFYDLVEQDVVNLLETEQTSAMNTLTWFTTKRSIDKLEPDMCLTIDFEHLYTNIFDRVCLRYNVGAPLVEMVSVVDEENSTVPKMPCKIVKSNKLRSEEAIKVRSIHRGTTVVRLSSILTLFFTDIFIPLPF